MPRAQHPSQAVFGHAHPVRAGGTVGAGLEQREQREERDAGCGEHPRPRQRGRAPRPQRVFLPTQGCRGETGAWRRMLPKNVSGTRVGLAGPPGESSGVELGASDIEAASKAKAGHEN